VDYDAEQIGQRRGELVEVVRVLRPDGADDIGQGPGDAKNMCDIFGDQHPGKVSIAVVDYRLAAQLRAHDDARCRRRRASRPGEHGDNDSGDDETSGEGDGEDGQHSGARVDDDDGRRKGERLQPRAGIYGPARGCQVGIIAMRVAMEAWGVADLITWGVTHTIKSRRLRLLAITRIAAARTKTATEAR